MPDMERKHRMSIRCFFEDGGHTQHYPEIEIDEIPKWVKAYWYTHPNLSAISVKVWTKEGENNICNG